MTDRIVSLSEVAQHTTKKDLWLVIHNKVYDVSQFRLDHPGGDRVLEDHAGKDASDAFDNVNHSKNAVKLLETLLVGSVPESEHRVAKKEDRDAIDLSLPVRTVAEVAQRTGTPEAPNGEMWIVIRNLVYDVTKFWKMHPGGPKPIKDLAGQDATIEFEKVGHTTNAYFLLKKYLIARLPDAERKDWANMADQQLKQYTLEEVSKHCKEGDYWMVLDNKVLNVTEFIGSHPGGREPLTHNAGTDATDEFSLVGHSINAKNKLKGLQIGVLVEKDRRSAKPSMCASVSYTDVTAASLNKAAAHSEGGQFPIATTIIIIVVAVLSIVGIVLLIANDSSNSAKEL
eukprot:GILI01013293.1.p1 GENE.GILI01013293.1~~GILI01013293.1.p1  ORF type:complete len:358 (+),score=62.06 GILI01013293.1:50-1075(+)